MKLQVEEFWFASVAVQWTVVDPTGKTDPEVGLQTGVSTREQESSAVTVKFTAVPARLAVNTSRLLGQAIVGSVVSTTVTVWLHSAKLPEASVARQIQ